MSARDKAFAALLPLTATIDAAIDLIDKDVADDRRLTAPLRSGWLPGQRASTSGGVRFNSATHRFGDGFATRDEVKRTSSALQESSNIFLWLVGKDLTFRIKRHPEDIPNPDAASLFSLDPQTSVQTVFMRWDIAADGKITNPTFVTVDEPRWSIPLWELRDAATAPAASIAPSRRGGPAVRSTKRNKDADSDQK